LNLRPLGPKGPNADPHGVAPGHLASYPFDKTGVEGGAGSHPVAPLPPVATPLGALVVHEAVGRLLTIREAAARLRVSRATVYRLVQAGALPVLSVSNSIRIPTESLTGAVLAPSCLPTSPAPTSRSRDSSGHPSRLPEPDRETPERPR
jgi:excisionase family DNA binding protein